MKNTSERGIPLSFRTLPVGGEVAMPKKESVADVAKRLQSGPARGLILLIHGYNNPMEDAEKAYQGFFEIQETLSELKEHRHLADNRVFIEVYWPGDADWGLLSFVFYMGSIANAVKSAEYLADVLASLATESTPLEVDIIGHSMGCRMATELLDQLGQRMPTERVRVGRIALMAAAVPTFMLDQGGALRPSYDAQLSIIPGRVKSLYSGSDMVLAMAFPIGQTLAPGPNGAFPTALGHEKWVTSSVPGNLEQQEITHAGHSDYWGWKKETRGVAMKANEQLRDFLGFNHAPDRVVGKRTTPESIRAAVRSVVPDRTVAEYVGSSSAMTA